MAFGKFCLAVFYLFLPLLLPSKVGIKAANVGSLIRQAPWLVSERIDGQMLSVVRFLRRVGVFDMERIVRAYPKILAANVRSDLVPKVSNVESSQECSVEG